MRFSSQASSTFHSGSDSLFVSKTFPINNVDSTNGHYWNMSDYEVLKKYCLTTPWLFCTCKFEFNQRVYYLVWSQKIKNQRSMPSVHSRHTYTRPSSKLREKKDSLKVLLITLSFLSIALLFNLLTSKYVFIEIISHDEIYSWLTFYFNLGPIRSLV